MTAKEDTEPEDLAILTVGSEDVDLYKATFSIDNVDLEMEIDTGTSSE